MIRRVKAISSISSVLAMQIGATRSTRASRRRAISSTWQGESLVGQVNDKLRWRSRLRKPNIWLDASDQRSYMVTKVISGTGIQANHRFDDLRGQPILYSTGE